MFYRMLYLFDIDTPPIIMVLISFFLIAAVSISQDFLLKQSGTYGFIYSSETWVFGFN